MSGAASQETEQLLHIGFNQDYSCFACATDNGFKIFNCEPFKERCRQDFSEGGSSSGIGCVEMLFRCNVLALVGGGKVPKAAPTKVLLWDDMQGEFIGELCFRSEVKAVRLRRDRIVVALEYKVFVYNFADLKQIDPVIDTVANPKGLVALSPNSSQVIMACPGFKKGHVRVELYNLKKTNHIAAHNSALSCLALNLDGTRLATASEKGTLIRVFDTFTGDCHHEFRRGAKEADIHSIAFNALSSYLCCSSDTGTVHVFSLEAKQEGGQTPGREGDSTSGHGGDDSASHGKSGGFSFKSLLPGYFSSEWSVAQFRIPKEQRTICAFGVENTIMVLTMDGGFYECSFDPLSGGECVQKRYHRFINDDGLAPAGP